MTSYNQKVEEKSEDLFSYLLFRFAPYWPLFILLLFFSGVAAWVYMLHATPLYDAKATILIKDEKKGVDDTKMLEALNIYTTTKIVENEIEVIRSRTLMTRVVERLDLYASVYEKGTFKDINRYGSSPVIIEAKDPKGLKASDQILFTYNKKNKPEVILLKVIGGTHGYPNDIDVHVEAWKFFKKQLK